jgi:hypothetical protein
MMPISRHFLKISVSRKEEGSAPGAEEKRSWNTCLHPRQQNLKTFSDVVME